MTEANQLLQTLGMLPNILLVITNLIKNNSDSIEVVSNTVTTVLKEFENDIPIEKIDLVDINGKRVIVEDSKYKTFITNFVNVFTSIYNKLPVEQKALFVLSAINVIRNEIPSIKRLAEANSHVEPEKTLIRIIKNAVDIKNKNYRNNTSITHK